MPTKVALDDLRHQIDRLDDQIHDLLIERAALAGQVAAAKGATGMWRPQREAAILRRLVARHRGAFPRAAVVRIWREIMSAMLGLEGRFSVAVCASPDQSGFWDMTRDHFGTSASFTTYQAAGAVMRAVTDDPTVVGVLPWPRDLEPDAWWRYLAGDDEGPRIVARLPFGGGDPSASALVVARAAIEPTDDDRSFIGIETADEVSRTRLLSTLAAAGCDVGFVASHRERADQPAVRHLIEIAGHLGSQDARLAAIRDAAPDEIRRAQWLGSYATPLGNGVLKDGGAKPAART
jgi:chorismate mutase/prephenate dehydratase